MILGLATTMGFTFSTLNVKLKLGLDETKEGWSCALIGLCVNVIVTVLLGLIFEHGVKLPSGPLAKFARPLNIHELFGTKLDRLCHPVLWLLMSVLIALTTPFYREFGSKDHFVGSLASWAFVSLAFSGVITMVVALAYLFLWDDHVLDPVPIPWGQEEEAAKKAEEVGMQMQGAQSPSVASYMQPQPTAPGMYPVIYMQPQPTAPGMYPVMPMPSADTMNVTQPYSNPAAYPPAGAEAYGYQFPSTPTYSAGYDPAGPRVQTGFA